ncbi:MAG: HD domain-containing protein [Acidobacteriaceae bacterium]|nr:HD domain-containing protein [Acidobacteriaceae bacterium]
MKSPFVDGLVPNELVTAQFLVLSKEIRQKKTGEPYLSLHLADRTGEIEAKMWDNVAEVMHTFERDHFVKVKGLPQLYNNRSQFVIHRLRRLEDSEVELSDYFPCSERNPEEMLEELRGIIAGISNAHLRALLTLIFGDEELVSLYKAAPAAKSIHHACRGGLLEHVLSLCALSKMIAAHYPEIDPDLLITGVILHDIGKVEELSYARSFGYSAEGQLLGHIVLGLRLIGAKFAQVPGFPPKLRSLVEHMIVSHHGELEFGSPKLPLFPEALLLHHLDNLDSKMNAMRSVLRRDPHSNGDFTGWVAPLERVLLRKERYLNVRQTPPPVENPLEGRPSAAAPPPPTPARPQPPQPPPATRKPEPHRPHLNTLFGEKLQAVLGTAQAAVSTAKEKQ